MQPSIINQIKLTKQGENYFQKVPFYCPPIEPPILDPFLGQSLKEQQKETQRATEEAIRSGLIQPIPEKKDSGLLDNIKLNPLAIPGGTLKPSIQNGILGIEFESLDSNRMLFIAINPSRGKIVLPGHLVIQGHGFQFRANVLIIW